MTAKHLEDDAYRTLASFRHELRRFLRFSEEAAATAGVTAQQHQALLALRAADGANGGEMLIGELADHLLLKPHSTTELVNRLALADLVERRADPGDARRVRVRLTRTGNARLGALAEAHRAELQRLRPLLGDLLARL